MDGTKFKKVVEYFGETNIMGILFDNSAVKMFSEGEFTLEGCYVEEIESLQFVAHDMRRNPYHTVKDVENVQGFVIRDSSVPFNAYDRVALRG